VGCFGARALPKVSQQRGQSEDIRRETAAEIRLETVRAALAEWPERLKPCVEAEDGQLEWHYYK